ncbi:Flavoredoxin [Fundidesulfovibrio magnetotacticus]|uniref:Flavoredoxin n=1 Tax=Fundidesulfovibrio magnetotacticus TaxID=2730080 RepID=A0A6V8LN05_9BACT|nr:flavin reductase family protein [Fundidesulfovibrio magnetotacticus]GFK94052.1 Flavoredoxin [Fundidesulfovibrio magnetotacticus]
MKTSLGAKTLASPTPAWVVCAYDQAGKATGATIAWGGICCSKPPCLAISLRAATYTHGCIMARRAFTVCIPSQDQAAVTDYFGMASGRDADKFAVAGLTAAKSQLVDAPFIEEFPLVVECQLAHVHELGLHTQFVGEIKDVKADPGVVGPEGRINLESMGTVLYAPGSRQYFGLGPLLGPGFALGGSYMK